MQAEGRPARLLQLRVGSTVETLLVALEERKVEFKLPDGNYAAFDHTLSLDSLRASCSQDGRNKATPIQFRCDQGPSYPYLPVVKQKLGQRYAKPRCEASVMRAVRVFTGYFCGVGEFAECEP